MIYHQPTHEDQSIPVVRLTHLNSLSQLSEYQTNQFKQQIKKIENKEEFFFTEDQAPLMME